MTALIGDRRGAASSSAHLFGLTVQNRGLNRTPVRWAPSAFRGRLRPRLFSVRDRAADAFQPTADVPRRESAARRSMFAGRSSSSERILRTLSPNPTASTHGAEMRARRTLRAGSPSPHAQRAGPSSGRNSGVRHSTCRPRRPRCLIRPSNHHYCAIAHGQGGASYRARAHPSRPSNRPARTANCESGRSCLLPVCE